MKAAISIPDHLFDAAEHLARRLGISRSELYQRAVEAFLAEHKHEDVIEVLHNLHGEGESGELGRVIQRLRDVWLDVEIF